MAGSMAPNGHPTVPSNTEHVALQAENNRHKLYILRTRLNEAWQAYIDQGIKFYAIPVKVSEIDEYTSQEAAELLMTAYETNYMPSLGSILWRFNMCFKFLKRCEARLELFLRLDKREEAARQVDGAHVLVMKLVSKIAELNWALEVVVAAKNLMVARGEFVETR